MADTPANTPRSPIKTKHIKKPMPLSVLRLQNENVNIADIPYPTPPTRRLSLSRNKPRTWREMSKT